MSDLDRCEISAILSDAFEAQTMLSCPYLRTGRDQCVTGCWQEPRCITNEPMGGWEDQVYSVAENLRFMAGQARGDHGSVKFLRDSARFAEGLIKK